ncbi:MAG TPA: MBL fold metallo-hydrolase [Flavobacteriales bacterium]|nr:MBL fold metallo-hydrolase [Flavobacteriales bacterium]
MLLTIVLFVLLAPIALLLIYFRNAPRIGSNPAGERLKRIQALPNYKDGQLHNAVATDMNMPLSTMLKVMWTMMKAPGAREPKEPLPTVEFDCEAWDRIPNHEIGICWFGHSSLLIKLDGLTFLTDPVFGERASTFTFAGPKHFPYTHRITVDQLPRIDVLLLSHDHYDHLCYETIVELLASRKVERCVAALGVGAHLEKWGMPSSMITEVEWWQQMEVGSVKLTFAPSRHFTGRTMRNRFSTLWGSFVLEGRNKRFYFGADSGYSPTFKELGQRFGRFDLVMLECGAYSEYWPDIHMFPEQAAQAAKDLNADVLMPIHWGKFALGLHPWKESITRITKRGEEMKLPLLTPRIGRIVAEFELSSSERWWEEVD